MSKTSMACALSIDTVLSGARPNKVGGKGYLWTFTLVWTAPIKLACRSWSTMAERLVSVVGMQGVRVFELHPGIEDRSHGLHVHCVVGRWFDVRLVRRVCRSEGWSCHVQPIRSNPYYITKYLHKSERAECLAGRRLWAAFGLPKRKGGVAPKGSATRVRDVQLRSMRSAAFHVARANDPVKSLSGAVEFGRVKAAATAVMMAFMTVMMPDGGEGAPAMAGAIAPAVPAIANLDYMQTIPDGRLLWPVEWRI